MQNDYFNMPFQQRLSAEIRSKVSALRRTGPLAAQLQILESSVDDLKSMAEIDNRMVIEFHETKLTKDYQEVFDKADPLVTVCIGTYNRSQLLVERSISSILNQTYKNIQLIVVGDACTDDTEQVVGKIRDSRLHFINLKERGDYPHPPLLRWMVAGTKSMNTALDLSEGDFITHLDDDDCHALHRVEVLLDCIKRQRVDFLWHPFWTQGIDYRWNLNAADTFRRGQVSTSSVFYHAWFKRIQWDINSYKQRDPGDWGRMRKIRYVGASALRYPEVLLQHFRERSQKS